MQRRLLFDNGSTTIKLAPALLSQQQSSNELRKRRTLVITFAEMEMNDPDLPGFGQPMLTKNGYDVLCVQKRAETWYQDLTTEDFVSAVSSVSRDYDTFRCYGVSMGAYAALYFGGAIGAPSFSVSPLASVDPRYMSLRGSRFKNFDGWTHKPLRAVPKVQFGDVIFYDPRHARDLLYMQQEVLPAFPNATVYRVPHGGHPVARAMVQMQLLPSLLFKWIAGEPLPSQPNITHGRKTSSAVYLRNFAEACRKRHPAIAGRIDAHLASSNLA